MKVEAKIYLNHALRIIDVFVRPNYKYTNFYVIKRYEKFACVGKTEDERYHLASNDLSRAEAVAACKFLQRNYIENGAN